MDLIWLPERNVCVFHRLTVLLQRGGDWIHWCLAYPVSTVHLSFLFCLIVYLIYSQTAFTCVRCLSVLFFSHTPTPSFWPYTHTLFLSSCLLCCHFLISSMLNDFESWIFFTCVCVSSTAGDLQVEELEDKIWCGCINLVNIQAERAQDGLCYIRGSYHSQCIYRRNVMAEVCQL